MKEHPTTTRDREEDLKKLANAFFEHLCLVSSKKSDVEMWGIDPTFPLGTRGTDYAENILNAIGYFEETACEACGHCEEAPEMDETAREYALELHAELGLYLERRWQDLNELADSQDDEESDEEDDEEETSEDEEVCYNCDETLDYDGLCPHCDYCGSCGYTNDECDCDEEDEEECEGCESSPCECDVN